MFNKIKKWLIGKEIKRLQTPSPVEESLDFYIKDAMKRHAAAQRTAEKLLKAKMLDKQTKETLTKIQELDEDTEDYASDNDDFADNLVNNLIQGYIKGFQNKTSSEPAAQSSFNLENLKPEHKDIAIKYLKGDFD